MNKLCLVTGANGYIAAHIVERLLQRGYRVRGTVRSVETISKFSHLLQMEGADSRLELVEADMLDRESLNRATRDVDIVFHVASPFAIDVKDAKKDLWEPAVNGTLNVLMAAQLNGVEQVILTSSCGAVADCPKPYVLTDIHWNEDSTLKRNPYFFSKAESEKAAWRYWRSIEGQKFKLVAMLPYMTIGPAHTKNLNSSMPGLIAIMKGEAPILDSTLACVSVIDVAEAHIAAAENPNSSGRYVLANSGIQPADMMKILKRNFPGFKYNEMRMPTFLIKLISYALPNGTGSFLRTNIGAGPWLFSSEKAEKELGIKLRSPEQCLVEQVNDFIRWGHVERTQ